MLTPVGLGREISVKKMKSRQEKLTQSCYLQPEGEH